MDVAKTIGYHSIANVTFYLCSDPHYTNMTASRKYYLYDERFIA